MSGLRDVMDGPMLAMNNHNGMRLMSDNWWTILTWGSHYDGPHGPWKSETEADDALSAWRERRGAEAGSIEAASALRIAGPFATREVARHADISDYTEYLVRESA